MVMPERAVDWAASFASRTKGEVGGALAEILALANATDIISFSGGFPDPQTFDRFIQAQGQALRARDSAPTNRGAWATRRKAVRDGLLAAMGSLPEKPCPLDPKVLG